MSIAVSISIFAYAMLRDDIIFIATMGFQLAAAIVILVLNIRYGTERHEPSALCWALAGYLRH